MLRVNQNKKESKSEAKKRLGDELNSVGIAKLELSRTLNDIKKSQESLDFKNREIFDTDKTTELKKDLIRKLSKEVVEIQRKVVDKKVEYINEGNKVAILVSERNEMVAQVIELNITLSEIKRIADEINKEVKISRLLNKDLEKSSELARSREAKSNQKILANSEVLQKQKSDWNKKLSVMKDLDEQISQKEKKHKQEIREMDGETKVMSAELEYMTTEYNEKKQRVMDFNKHMKEKEKKIISEEKNLADKGQALQNIKRELKRKWLVMQKGEDKEEIDRFFN